MSPRVVLIGLPGCGKSTTGRRLAKILVLPFADSDELVEKQTGRAVRDIFAESGEAEFRRLEAATVSSALTSFDGVLALGGGALTPATRQALLAAEVPIVLLQAPLSTLIRRVGDGHTRPLLAADPPARLAALAEQREPLYREVATLVVDTERRTPGNVAATIAARLHDRAARA